MLINKRLPPGYLRIAAALLVVFASSLHAESDTTGPQIMQASCQGCHSYDPEQGWSRISGQRKTPEGWQMTLVRMQEVHKARIVDPAGGDSDAALRTLVKYLADTQGLAPSESEPFRYILEQELNTIEQHDTAQFGEMCARCHSGARVGLQRRSEEEWRRLVHFHLGQFPTVEYSLMGRDRDWRGIAFNEMVPYLAANYPLEAQSWQQWQSAAQSSYQGSWRLVGSMPGKGGFQGVMVAEAKAADHYSLKFSGEFEGGEPLSGSGNAIMYTGYEWRATLKLDGSSYRQVMAASNDGTELVGRMFQREHSERGLRLRAVRDTGAPRLLAVSPDHLRAGSETTLKIYGSNLQGEPSLGPDLRIVKVLQQSPDQLEVRVAVAADASEGVRELKVGASVLESGITVFERVARLELEPAYAVARVGGGGGSQPEVAALFDAIAWSAGADGKAGTGDDLRIGRVSANWSVAPYNAVAAADRDQLFAGSMDKDSGMFTPAVAGPNPNRKYQTNNAGNLKVIARFEQDGNPVQGEAHLMVTVQRWNNPPIR